MRGDCATSRVARCGGAAVYVRRREARPTLVPYPREARKSALLHGIRVLSYPRVLLQRGFSLSISGLMLAQCLLGSELAGWPL